MFRASWMLLLVGGLLMAQSDPRAAGIGRKALNLLIAGRYPDLLDMCTPEVRAQLTEEVLRTQIGPRMRDLGAVQKIGEPSVERVNQMSVVLLPVQYASATINWRFTVDAEGKIAGLFFQPGEQTEASDWQRPSYSRPDMFREREVTVGDGPWKLPGTLTVPNRSAAMAAVVLVQGSGPQDRDESVGANKPFRDLAEGLASRGIAVLRYEKRTRMYASRLAASKDMTVQQETVEDAIKAAAFLRGQPEVASGRVFVLGHSLGGYLAPRIAQQDQKLAGVILMAANVRPLEDLVTDQLQWIGLSGPQLEKAHSEILKALPPAYVDDLKGYNPAEEARKLLVPMLILQGERDYQVTMKDFNLWRTALGDHWNVTFRSFPALNHLFVAGEGRSMPAEYAQPGHVDSVVIEQIAGWINRAQ